MSATHNESMRMLTRMQEWMRKWVKVVGSDVRIEYPQICIDEADGVHFHYEDDRTRPIRRRVPAILLEDNGGGVYTSWTFGGTFGPIGVRGKLAEGVTVTERLNAADRRQVEILNAQERTSMQRQARAFVALGGNPQAVRGLIATEATD